MNSEKDLNHEREISVQTAYLFDVDGVITNPSEKKITENSLLEILAEKLQANIPITLNTGRSNEWMIERVIIPLRDKIKNKAFLSNFFAVGEKGLTWVAFDEDSKLVEGVFDEDGSLVEGFDLSVFLDGKTVRHFETLSEETKKLIDMKYSHSTFFDGTKKAMVSTEMLDGYYQPGYHAEQGEFVRELEALLEKGGLSDKFKIDPTTIATDIQIPEAGKHLGAKRILGWLKSRNINSVSFIAVGDSVSDLEMADELNNQGKSVEFWYVNPNKSLHLEKPYPIRVSKQEFGRGTVEMIESESSK